MNTSTVSLPVISIKRTRARSLPITARGGAMYTIDWFLNGHPTSHNHDSP